MRFLYSWLNTIFKTIIYWSKPLFSFANICEKSIICQSKVFKYIHKCYISILLSKKKMASQSKTDCKKYKLHKFRFFTVYLCHTNPRVKMRFCLNSPKSKRTWLKEKSKKRYISSLVGMSKMSSKATKISQTSSSISTNNRNNSKYQKDFWEFQMFY